MFENEEEKLREVRMKLEKVPIPSEQLDQAIQHGFTIADLELRAKRRKRRKSLWSTAVAVIFLLAFVTSIRVSPAFANAVATIPGMGKLVELIQYDKGLQGIVANDYYQAVDVSETKDGFTLTIDGVILDETGMVLSLTLAAPYSVTTMGYMDFAIYNDGKEMSFSSISYNSPEQLGENRIEDIVDVMFSEKTTFDSQEFILEVQLDNTLGTTFSIPFTVPQEVKKAKAYSLNQEIEVENQKMTIQNVTIYPLRVAVNIAFDESNSMQIFNFEDMRLEDEKGEVWSSIANGVSGSGSEEGVQTYYLQSNYFEQPEKLYFKMNKIQALPKDEPFLLVDLEKQKVLKQPSAKKIEITEITSNKIEARFLEEKENHGYSLFSDVFDGDGKNVVVGGQAITTDEGYVRSSIYFSKKQYKNPVKVNLAAYPNHINEDISIELE